MSIHLQTDWRITAIECGAIESRLLQRRIDALEADVEAYRAVTCAALEELHRLTLLVHQQNVRLRALMFCEEHDTCEAA